MSGEEAAARGLRTAHLLRVNSYLDWAMVSVWAASARADVTLGMAEASVRGKGPGGADEELLRKLRALIRESREHYADNDFPAAMSRVRTSQDLVSIRIIKVSEGREEEDFG
ncbi:MAG: hypothetical protein H0V53_00995 [Rubrobacter sp.]|nr:hypothetical protein [Rubrobacter sp.]